MHNRTIAMLAMLAASLGNAPAKAQKSVCDRACLSGFITGYVDALAHHRPAALPLAKSARFTENGVAIPLGEGLWTGVSAVGERYRYDYIDTAAGQVAAHLDFVENGKPGLMSLRLKVEGGRISEIETVVNRGAANAERMVPPEPLWEAPEPSATRLTRAQLAAVAQSYLAAVAAGDGSKAPFDPDTCVRLENGGVMAQTANDHPPQPGPNAQSPVAWIRLVASTLGMGCAKQLDTGIYGFITSYNNARFPVIDVERQIVFGQWNFRRRGDVKGVTYNGAFVPFMESTQFPNENLLGQAFKIRHGKIIRVQGVFLNANVYKSGTGWTGGHDGPVAGPR
ncbi:hypothetical protein [Novosphingobium sediminicola]|nr:hypothetical protein [Novosphingobium sediminicola]